MKFGVGFLLAILAAVVCQASAQAPGDEASSCANQRGAYPPDTRMLMDSRNYEQLITGSGAVWQALNADKTGRGVGGRCIGHYLRNILLCIFAYLSQSVSLLHAVEKFIRWSVCSSAEVM